MSDWKLGVASVARGDRAVVLDIYEERRFRASGAETVRFDQLLGGARVQPGERVVVEVPKWRGHGFIALLEWLVCARLCRPDETWVTWIAARRGGATGVRRTLEARGWGFDETKTRSHRIFEGVAPAPGSPPEPRGFRAELAGQRLSFAADWGVFSRGHIDDGTKLLFDGAVREIELARGSVSRVVDIGTGYGALGIGLAAAGLCARAVGSEIDYVAVHLARRNAEAAGVRLELIPEDDPALLPQAPITVCEVPTHASFEVTARLVRGLARRSSLGLVLMAVHTRLGARYTRLLRSAGAEPTTVEGESHLLLRLGDLP